MTGRATSCARSRGEGDQPDRASPADGIESRRRWGFRKDIQHLVIFSFALQNNLTFYLHGGPLGPTSKNLDDALELREQALPSEDLWRKGKRAAAILGVVASPLLTAANVARFSADVKATAARHRQGGRSALRLGCASTLGGLVIDTRGAPRLQTAQAA